MFMYGMTLKILWWDKCIWDMLGLANMKTSTLKDYAQDIFYFFLGNPAF